MQEPVYKAGKAINVLFEGLLHLIMQRLSLVSHDVKYMGVAGRHRRRPARSPQDKALPDTSGFAQRGTFRSVSGSAFAVTTRSL